jgi:hypothetical protein
MKKTSLFLISILSFLWTSCDNTTVDNAADFNLETIDKEQNTISLRGTIHYRLKNRLEKKFLKKYGRRHYKDSVLVPVISTASREILSDYSAGEIYSYKRDEFVQKLDLQTKTAFAEFEIEVTSFSIWSVGLSDTLMSRFQKEHALRFQNAIKKCSRETKGVVTKIDSLRNGSRIVFYEFTVEHKNYQSSLGPGEDRNKVSPGDTLVIEFACENANFHRVKK